MSVNATSSPSTDDQEYELNQRQVSTAARIAKECNISTKQILEELANRTPAIKRGHDAIRRSVADTYRLYGMIRNSKKVREAVVSTLKEAGKWKTNNKKLLNTVLSFYLDVDRKRASTYAQAILAALDREINYADFIDFVRSNGGLDAIARVRVNTNKTDDTDEAEDSVSADDPDSPRVSKEDAIDSGCSGNFQVRNFVSWEEELREFCRINTGFEKRPDREKAVYRVRVIVLRNYTVFFQVFDPLLATYVVYESEPYEQPQ